MGLETGTYLNDLVTTNPDGATDAKSEGDNHIRLIKSTLKATFPGMAGAAWRVQTKAADYPLVATDNMTQITVTAAATISGTAATLGNGFAVIIYNSHSAAITIPGSYSLESGNAAFVTCNGSAFIILPFALSGWRILDSDTPSGTTVTLTGGSGTLYRSHLLVMQNITLAGDSNIVLRTGNGSIDTGNNYQQTTIRAVGSSLSCATSGGVSYIDLTSNPDMVESSGNAFSGSVEILAQTAISRSYFHFNGNFINSAGSHEHLTVSGYYNGGFDRVQIISTAANFSGGSVALYGLR